MKIIVLSMDNEIGKKRREKISYDFEWFKCEPTLEFIHNKVRHFWNKGIKKKLACENCTSNWYKLFKKIYDEKIDDCIVMEDDNIIKKDIYDRFIKDQNKQLCYLNGQFITPHHFKPYYNFHKQNGLNTINYETSKILCTYGLYIPKHTDIKCILTTIEECKCIRAFDIFMMKHKCIKHYYYPSVFLNDDDGYSQLGNKSYGVIDNYRLH